jgi:predicted DNA-binding protein (MmcQ/YjbR family)
MNLESVREYCLTLPHATEMVQWVDHLLFKVGGKMFAIMALEPRENVLSFKATPDQFFELQELEGVIPAPYMARNQWLALQRFDALRDDELRDLLATSHRLIFEKLPKRTQQDLAAGKTATKRTPAEKSTKAKSKKPSVSKKTKPVAKKSTRSKPQRPKAKKH